MNMATVVKKTVLTQFSSFSQKVEFEVPSEIDKKTEREVLLEEIKASSCPQGGGWGKHGYCRRFV